VEGVREDQLGQAVHRRGHGLAGGWPVSGHVLVGDPAQDDDLGRLQDPQNVSLQLRARLGADPQSCPPPVKPSSDTNMSTMSSRRAAGIGSTAILLVVARPYAR
jgi:hypothetical protein